MKTIESLLENKKILVLGLGVEGLSTYQYLRNIFPDAQIGIADKQSLETLDEETKSLLSKDSQITFHLGVDYLSHLDQYDCIIRSPGISPYLPELKKITSTGKQITTQTELFLQLFRHQTIGVTGTKGKSTTTSLIYHLLKHAGKKVFLIGNIGNPAFTIFPEVTSDSLFVYELSSHQLNGLSVSPHIAIVLNVLREHLDYYPDFKTYRDAKAVIAEFQTTEDYVVFNASSEEASYIAQQSKGHLIPYAVTRQSNEICFVKNETVTYISDSHEESIVACSQVPLPGAFNLNNVMPAVVVGKLFGIKTETIAQAIQSFKTLPGRLENMGTFKGITFYDDALATIPEATIAALETLGSEVQTLLAGGFDRQQDYSKLAEKILQTDLKTLILFPTTGEDIWNAVLQKADGKKLPEHFFVNSMEEAVRVAYEHTESGKSCLSSAAAPSFGLFKNYKEKSQLYKQCIEQYAQ